MFFIEAENAFLKTDNDSLELFTGYFMIEGKLYCEVHARRVAEAPGADMKYAGAVYRYILILLDL